MSRWTSAGQEIALIVIITFLCLAGGALPAAASGPGSAGDTVADVVLGQLNFISNAANTADPSSMSTPEGMVIDTTVTPNRVYVSDEGCNRVLGWSSITALANGQPANIVIGQPNFTSCSGNSTGLNASSLSQPDGVAVDAAGNLYVSDLGNNRALVFPKPFSSGFTAGEPATLVFGQNGNFTANSCNGGGAGPTASTLCNPDGIGVDKNGNVYVGDRSNNRMLEFDNAFATGNTKANRVFGQCGSFTTNLSDNNCASPPASGPPSANNFQGPVDGLAINPATCDVWVSDENGNRVLEFLNPTGAASCSATTSGTTAHLVLGQPGFTTINCNNGSLAVASQLCTPKDLHVDSSGNVFVGDRSNSRTLEFPTPAANGAAATVALGQSSTSSLQGCNGFSSPTPGVVSATSECSPIAVREDSTGAVWVTDTSNNRVLKYPSPLSSGEAATLVLGEFDFTHNSGNFIDASSLSQPLSPYADSLGHVYVADRNNHRVLGWKTAASLTTGQPADLVIGQPDFEQNACNNNSFGAAPNAQTLCNPQGIVADSAGNIWVGDTSNSRVLRYPSPFTSCGGGICATGLAATIVIGKANFISNGCDAGGISATTLCNPPGVGLDSAGDLYVADFNDHRVLFYPAPQSNGMAATQVIGQATFTTATCNGGGVSAISLCNPNGLSVDASNNLWVADYNNNRVLMYLNPQKAAGGGCPTPGTPGCAGDTTADLVLGQGSSFTTNSCRKYGISQDDLCNPGGVALDAAGNVYVSDNSNSRALFYLEPLATGALQGCATLPSGPPGNCAVPGTPGKVGDLTADRVFGQADDFTSDGCNFGVGTAPTADSLCFPSHIVPGVSTAGGPANPTAINSDVYIADASNNRVLKYSNPQAVPGAVTFTATEAFGNVAQNNTSLAKTDTFTVPASSVAVTFSNATISGTNAADFHISSNGCSGRIVVPGGKCAMSLTFKPSAAVGTAETAKLTLNDNASNAPQSVNLTGTSATQTSITGASGSRPNLTLSYGTVPTSSTKTVTLVNNQATAISVSVSAITGTNAADFAITKNTCSTGTVAAFKSCAVSVTFTPTQTSPPETASFTITDSPDLQSPTTINMTGQK
jgi:sugar lactone lactonase YvrE